MPTGILSVGTIAQRLRAAAVDAEITTKQSEDLSACAVTLEGGWPSTKQLRAIAKVIDEIDQVEPELKLRRCVTSLDHWVAHNNGTAKEVKVKVTKAEGIPDWMKPIAPAEVADTPASAIVGAIKVVLDEVVGGDWTQDTFDDLDALIRTLRRLA